MGIEPTLPAWKAGTLPLSYTRGFAGVPTLFHENPSQPRAPLELVFPGVWSSRSKARAVFCFFSPRVVVWFGRPVGSNRGLEPDPTQSDPTWVEQDSNLRRHCHQIYSLAPLAAWVSTRLVPGSRHFHRRTETHFRSRPEEISEDLTGYRLTELAVGLELTTLGLQNRCSAD
jgi:hypothetical protein